MMALPAIELALAVSSQPLSVDRLSDWGVARPSEMLVWLEGARERGVVLEDASAPGLLGLTESGRERALASATADDFRRIAAQPELAPMLLDTGRRAASRRGLGMASNLYRALFDTLPAEAFPGGPVGFVAALVESVRLYRGVSWLRAEVLDRAITIATELGDLASQAVLLAAYALSVQSSEDGAAVLARAREAADAVGGDIRVEVMVYTAVHLVMVGRLRQGIAAFEALLGDVPIDLHTDNGRLLVDPQAICVLAVAYSENGQQPRAVELLQSLRALGEELERQAIVEEAQLFLAFVFSIRGAYDQARRYVESAFRRFSRDEADPSLTWFAALALALTRAAEGQLAEARAVLESGVAAWKRAGAPPLMFRAVYQLSEQLEAAGEGPLAALDLVSEASRAIQSPLLQAAGLGHRFLARRALGGLPTEVAFIEATADYRRAIERLDEAGSIYDLVQCCREAAELAEQRGCADEARALAEKAARLQPVQEGRAEPDLARLRAMVLDLGRLPARGEGQGFWGELSARLCSGLGVERCALVELEGCPDANFRPGAGGEMPRLLAARGGTRRWQERILSSIREAHSAPRLSQVAEGRGHRLLVPFAAAELGRRGIALLESVHCRPVFDVAEEELFEALSVQLGVLLRNVTLWQELAKARARLEQENRYFRESGSGAASGDQMVAHSSAMRVVIELVERVAPSSATVLITGETGVGKELVAREVHRRSQRCDAPLIAVHVASLSPGLVASGLFGHERGAFTGATERSKGRFELADGGTLLLDEVGELSLEDQIRLLRVLQEGTFERVGGTTPLRSDFRLIAATNRDLEEEVRAGRFREDLYYRLSAFPIRVPPLRERREEIPTLALFFMERLSRQRGVAFEGIGEADMERLKSWDWPGNVRELEHVIERASLLSEPPRLRIPPLDGGLKQNAPKVAHDRADDGSWLTLAEAERRYITRVLQYTDGRVTGVGGAAEILDLKPSTLNFRIGKLGLKELLREIRDSARSGSSRPSQ